jgi:hypothetical protein
LLEYTHRNTPRQTEMTTLITEQSGARWSARATGSEQPGRAFWVLLLSGTSQARPGICGFYASSLNTACAALSN